MSSRAIKTLTTRAFIVNGKGDGVLGLWVGWCSGSGSGKGAQWLDSTNAGEY